MISHNNTASITAKGTLYHIDVIENTTMEKTITIPAGGELHYLIICLNSECKITIESEAEDVHSHIFAICPSKNNEKSHLNMVSRLLHSNTNSDMFILSLAGDNALIDIAGGVFMGPGIVKPSGHLTEKNIILGKNTTVNALPLLDVHSNDVQASHGASIEKLQEKDLFYLTAKGINPQTSSHLMIQGHIEYIIDHFSDQEDTEQLEEIKKNITEYILS